MIFGIYDIFVMVPILTLASIITYSFFDGVVLGFEFILLSLGVLFHFFIWNKLLKRKLKIYVNYELSKYEYKYIDVLMYLSVFFILVYLVLAGFPIFSSNPAENKLQVSQYPILVRFYRISGLLPIILALTIKNERLRFRVSFYTVVMIILGFCTAFKGYPVPYILGFIMIKLVGKKIKFRSILYMVGLLYASFLYVSIAEKIPLINVLAFMVARFSFVQLLGTVELYNIYGSIEYLPVISEILLLPRKLFMGDAMSLQQILYQSYHILDDNKLELSNFYFAEIYLFWGWLGVIFTQAIIILLIKLVMIKRMNIINFCYLILLNFSMIDGLLNGKLVFRIIDACVFILLTIILVKIFMNISCLFRKFIFRRV